MNRVPFSNLADVACNFENEIPCGWTMANWKIGDWKILSFGDNALSTG